VLWSWRVLTRAGRPGYRRRVLVECDHCGAPLDVSGKETVLACAYCNRRHKLPRMRTISPDTPVDWKPPEVWTPPERARARRRPLRLHPVKIVMGIVWTVRRVVGVAFTLLALPAMLYALGIGAGVIGDDATGLNDLGALASQVRQTASDPAVRERASALKDELLQDERLGQLVEAASDTLQASALGALMWDGKEPFVCDGNTQATLRGVTASLEGRTAIRASGNCRLRIEDCTIDAWEALSAEANAHVVLERSTLRAKGKGISAGGNARIELVDTSVVSQEVALQGKANARFVLATGRVEGKKRAVELSSNARGELREAELIGKVKARRGRLEGYPRR
jgi:hypothetical protein